MNQLFLIALMFGTLIAIFSAIGVIGLLIQYPEKGLHVIKRISAGIVCVVCGLFVLASPMIASYLIDEDFIQWGWIQNRRTGSWENIPFFISWLFGTLVSGVISLFCGFVAFEK